MAKKISTTKRKRKGTKTIPGAKAKPLHADQGKTYANIISEVAKMGKKHEMA